MGITSLLIKITLFLYHSTFPNQCQLKNAKTSAYPANEQTKTSKICSKKIPITSGLLFPFPAHGLRNGSDKSAVRRTGQLHSPDAGKVATPNPLIPVCPGGFDDTADVPFHGNAAGVIGPAHRRIQILGQRATRIPPIQLDQRCQILIALSACLAGEIPRAISAGDYQKAVEMAKWYQSVFGRDNFYIEIQNHGIDEQIRVLPQLVRLS